MSIDQLMTEARHAMQQDYFAWIGTLIPQHKKPAVQDAWQVAWQAGRDYERARAQIEQEDRDDG